MRTVKLTKTATELLQNKKVGDVITTFRDQRSAYKRNAAAIMLLQDEGYIKFLRQYSFSDDNYGRIKPMTVIERHYEVLKVPK